MRYQVISNFQVQRKTIEARLKEPKPYVPRLTKVSTVPQWDDSFRVFLSKCPSEQGCATMAYVSRTFEAFVSSAPSLHVNQLHCNEHGSTAKKYEHLLSQVDDHYGNSNEFLYTYLEEATRGTVFVVYIKYFERDRIGRDAWLDLNNHHVCEIKWRAILREAKNYIIGTKWDGNTSVSLEKHINNLQSYYNDMENSADHIAYQLPNGRPKVQIFADSIEECTVGFVLPHDPFFNK